MRYLVILAAVLLSIASCKKQSHYTCYCTFKDSANAAYPPPTEVLNIGRSSSEDAYARCRSFKDTSKYDCVMQIIK